MSYRRWPWFAYCSLFMVALSRAGLCYTVVRRQHPKLIAVLSELAPGLACKPHGLRGATTALAALLATTASARYVYVGLVPRDDRTLAALHSTALELGTCTFAAEACLFAALAQAVADEYVRVNARFIRDVLLGACGPVPGVPAVPRYNVAVALRVQHQRVGELHRELWGCFGTQVCCATCRDNFSLHKTYGPSIPS